MNPVRSLRIFDSDFLEFCSLSSYQFLLCCWAPTIGYLLYSSPRDLSHSALFFFIGSFCWTLQEYILHRFLFHMEDYFYFPRHSKFYALHFLVHGIHHAFPQDPMRIVMPPVLGHIIYYTSIRYPWSLLLTYEQLQPFLAGMMISYLFYDLMHYFCH